MPFKKNIRYLYWLTIEFFKKNAKLFLVSFVATFLLILSFISISPFLQTLYLSKTDRIGRVGKFELNKLPEEIYHAVSSGLIFINEKGEITPALASSWESFDNGKRYRLTLRSNLYWSDGSKFTAYDINYDFKDVAKKVIDEKTIYFTLEKPLPIFLVYLKKPVIKPPINGVAGLYRVVSVKSEGGTVKQLILAPNKKGIPQLIYKFYDSESQLIAAYKKGEINRMMLGKKSVADIFSAWKNTQVEKSVDYSKLLTLFYNFNNQLLRQKDVRRAIALGIDQSTFRDLGEPADGPIPAASPVFNTDLKGELYDPTGARKVIKKTVEGSTESAKLNFVTYYEYLTYSDSVVDGLKDMGFTVNENIASFDKPATFDLLLAYWNVPSDPDQYYFWHSTQTKGNIGSYKNLKVDKLLEDGRKAVSFDDRKKIYREFQKVLSDDPPAVFLFYPYLYTVRRK